MTFRALLTPALVVFAASVVPAISRADIEVYTFEAPVFTLGESTPIGPTAPNSGDPGFTTSFADAADPGGAEIVNIGPRPLSGQFLTGTSGALTLTFNQPVFALSVAFVTDAPIIEPLAFFELVTPSGTFDQSNMFLPGSPFANGILNFSSATPFTTATLEGFDDPGVPALFFDIDDLSLSTSPVPEPASWLLLGTSLAGFLALRRRKN